ncbi:TPA: DotH/IcmK family type IV secretion protein [Vibrio parahaemolyticus]
MSAVICHQVIYLLTFKIKMLRKFIVSSILVGVASTGFANEEQKTPPPLMLKESRDTELRDLATYQLKRRFMPMNESNAIALKKGFEQRDKMVNSSVREPEEQNRTLTINPSMVSGKPTIYSSVNYITTIVFVDKFGNPWDVEDIGIGAGSFFDYKTVNPYTVWLFPKKKYKKSNLSILLKGLLTPISFNLEESPEKVDYTIQAKVLKAGANTEVNEFSYSPLQAEITNNNLTKDDAVMSMSDGITPAQANKLNVLIQGRESSDIQAWQYEDSYYVRLRGRVMSPEPEPASHPNVDGIQLFKIPRISSLFIEKDGILITGILQKPRK